MKDLRVLGYINPPLHEVVVEAAVQEALLQGWERSRVDLTETERRVDLG